MENLKIENSVIDFETINRFERDIVYDSHSLSARICRSEALLKIISQNKMVIPILSEYLNSDLKIEVGYESLSFDLGHAWTVLFHNLATKNNIKNSPLATDPFEHWKEWAKKQKFMEIKTTKRSITNIIVDISDEACLPFGFLHGEIAFNPKSSLEVTIMGVAPGNDGIDVLWYINNHPSIKGLACYWGGEKDLIKAGFKKAS